MGVPALFRWLSKKYPKIIYPVVEDEERTIPSSSGEEVIVPVDISKPNPNGEEFDNLYLDMNGIVHPCTHPEGKPPPETEEDMMVEIFSYTERVVNMIRPRKLLFMAIDGVAPRAKMNQQRSRRFRTAQEAREKEEERKLAIAEWEAMGKTLSEEERNKKAWDSNAITPGTPFMMLLASSLRYWVVQKMNTDPGWANLKVIISDASVPGEGEHKIMDFIRRQRSNQGHDPNTKHVIYGLDADLIMLALATHEPHFRVLREDVFSQANSNACRLCGKEGHYAAQCPGVDADALAQKVSEKKPFIFLDVAILREYLDAELSSVATPFPFHLEKAIDDWVLLIFFVGNDFLPHLPSLEIREGAIDTLLRIWKETLPKMGGYITNNGQLELARAQIIFEGLARREDDIFKRRRELEQRQDGNAKRRKIIGKGDAEVAAAIAALDAHPSLPARPNTAKVNSMGPGGPKNAETEQMAPVAAQALAGSNRDVVANRRYIRLANMSAAEVLKAELASLQPVKKSASSFKSSSTPAVPPAVTPPAPAAQPPAADKDVPPAVEATMEDEDAEVPGLGSAGVNASDSSVVTQDETPGETAGQDHPMDTSESTSRGTKRKVDTVEEEDAEAEEDHAEIEDDDDVPTHIDKNADYAMTVKADGTVEQEDHVRLWESGYQERYYRQKFGTEYDAAIRKKIAAKYVEGIAWVLAYYYQGTPSWKWFYPYHFAPFAADFMDIASLDLKFELGQPFKPFEQLMGVFPASSRVHIPEPFHPLMTNEDSPIIDFYPETFEVDMNGKRMAWQGVALLPFIEEKRLLDSMSIYYPQLSQSEKDRNSRGNDVIFVYEDNPFYHSLEALYGKRKTQDPVPIDPTTSQGMSGSLLPCPDYLPGSTYNSPFTAINMPDVKNDRSLSALYFFPKQLTPHRSVLLPGVKRSRPVLEDSDREAVRRGRRGRGGGGGGGHNDWGRSAGQSQGYSSGGRDYGGNQWQRNGRGGSHQSNYGQGPQGYNQYQDYQQNSYSSNGYGGRDQSGYNNSYDRGRGRGGASRGQPNYNSYNNSASSYGGYGGGGGNGGGRGGYGGSRGGYGGGQGGYGGYGGEGQGGYNGGGQGGYGGYGGNQGGYGGGYGGNGGYGGYGGGSGGRGGYGGYGGGGNNYGTNSYGDYQGSHNGPNRGRGRGGRW